MARDSSHWLVLAAHGDRIDEARASAEAFLAGLREPTVEILSRRDGYMPYEASEVKDTFEALKARIDPDLVLTHTRDDLHQDHRLVCDLTWNTFRDHLVLEYEIPKYDGDLGRPNTYVPWTTMSLRESSSCSMRISGASGRRIGSTTASFAG